MTSVVPINEKMHKGPNYIVIYGLVVICVLPLIFFIIGVVDHFNSTEFYIYAIIVDYYHMMKPITVIMHNVYFTIRLKCNSPKGPLYINYDEFYRR